MSSPSQVSLLEIARGIELGELIQRISNIENRLLQLELHPQHHDNSSNSSSLSSPIPSPIPLHTPSTTPGRNTPITDNFIHVSRRARPQKGTKQSHTPCQTTPIRPGVKTYAGAVISNRFGVLQVEPTNEDIAEHQPEQQSPPTIPSIQENRRPIICETETYIQNMQKQPLSHKPLTVPTTPQPEITSIVSDSMTRSIKVQHFNSYLDNQTELAKISKFPAAHANQVRLYTQYTLQMEKPTQLIINAGSNDVSYDTYTGHADADIIADRILNIARDARKAGVRTIYISGLMVRRGKQYISIIKQINHKLISQCMIEQFHFIDNSNILLGDLCDGLHLNPKGNMKFVYNLLQCCHSYNPYLNAASDGF